ncbi:MAG TPA: hypothetical protein VFE98_00675 [Candidatus Bathyarchaeia archaeon]|nr:hypothetical protein [Candidatus Bathyarchaeia archaeon]
MQSNEAGKKDWDFIENFQTRANRPPSPIGTGGLKALTRIRTILEPHWVASPSRPHPLRNKFHVAYEFNYVWFTHFARKLEEMIKIPGHENALARLGVPEQFSHAWFELEMALRLRLSKFSCIFVKQQSSATPDLRFDNAGRSVDLEVSSLNQPEQDAIAMQILDAVYPFQPGLVAGGLFSPQRYKGDVVEWFRSKTADAVRRAIQTNQMVEVNEPERLQYYVAPEAQAHLIPEKYRGHFALATSTPKSKKDRVIEKIDSKMKDQLSNSGASALVMYDTFSTPDDVKDLVENYDVPVKIGTYKNLACVALVTPIPPHETVAIRKRQRDGTTYIEQRLPEREAEKCIIWENPIRNHSRTVESLVGCFTEYPESLRILFNLAQE